MLPAYGKILLKRSDFKNPSISGDSIPRSKPLDFCSSFLPEKIIVPGRYTSTVPEPVPGHNAMFQDECIFFIEIYTCIFVLDLPKSIQDPLSHTDVEQQKLVPPSPCIEFHPQILHCNGLQKNHIWKSPNTPCFSCNARTFPHTPDRCIKFTARNNHHCVSTHYCECYYRKLDEHSGCFCCHSSANKLLSDVSPLHMHPWYGGFNNNSHYHGIYLPKHGSFGSNSLSTPLERIDIHAREVANRPSHNFTSCHTGKSSTMFGTRLEHNLKVVRDEESLLSKVVTNEDELPTKKMKMTPIVNEVGMKKEDMESQLQKSESQSSIPVEQENVSKADNKPAQEIIKQEFSEQLSNQTTCGGSELSNGELDSERKDTKTNNEKGELNTSEKSYKKAPQEIHKNVPHQGTKKSQQAKSKKRHKDNNTKPYNTRMVTSRPRTYSSDFVIPDEEEEWRQDKEGYQMKGRQRTKLNRLLANEHERRRVAQLNSAYQDLRQLIPGYQCDTKLPKIKILKYAINYIAHLDDILGTDFYEVN